MTFEEGKSADSFTEVAEPVILVNIPEEVRVHSAFIADQIDVFINALLENAR